MSIFGLVPRESVIQYHSNPLAALLTARREVLLTERQQLIVYLKGAISARSL